MMPFSAPSTMLPRRPPAPAPPPPAWRVERRAAVRPAGLGVSLISLSWARRLRISRTHERIAASSATEGAAAVLPPSSKRSANGKREARYMKVRAYRRWSARRAPPPVSAARYAARSARDDARTASRVRRPAS